MSIFPFMTRLLFLTFLPFFIPTALSHTCSSSKSPCPPFTSTPPFPFSSSPGCGHPFFQIKCSHPHAIISINNLSFSLLTYPLNSTSIILSPINTSKHYCTTSSIPHKSINLTNSPFRVSDSSCSRLSVLKPCPPPNLPNCSKCSFECKLIKNPLHILHDCGSKNHQVSEQGCQDDVLGYLDNFLKLGIEVEWDENEPKDTYFSKCKSCREVNGVCGFNSSDLKKQFLCFQSKSRISPPWIHQQSYTHIIMVSLVFLFMCSLVFISIATFMFRRNNISKEEDPKIIFLHGHISTRFTYEELESSTNNFDPRRKIGDGGFGSVYLGQLHDNRIVAVKHLHKHPGSSFTTKSFCNEIMILSSLNHPNLVKLHGYCSDPRGLLLVYDYIPNGTISEHLHGKKNGPFLTWELRIEIALQISLAIEYLHFSVLPPIVHRDITSNNIFVEKDMRIKVGDFGLSRLMVKCNESVWTGPQGTPGYLDPDYYNSFRLTEKSDVYSFGVVLLELISGMKAVDQRRGKGEMALVDLAVCKIQLGLLEELVDPVLVVDNKDMEGVGAAAELAFRCVAADKDDRPDAREVVAELSRVRNRTIGS